ncbi:MAG: hypothetical protein J5666_01590 [Bacilli bacterium]|nr:hypothetical protein [Bacilli bacterium]
MYCSKCGNKLEDGFVCCPKCGQFVDEEVRNEVKKNPSSVYTEETNVLSVLAIILCIIPIAGWILGGLGLWHSKKIYGNGKVLAIVALCLSTFFFILSVILIELYGDEILYYYYPQEGLNQAVYLLFKLIK